MLRPVTARVLVVDDHEVVRRGVAGFIDGAEELEVVAEAGSCREAVVRAAATCPDVAVIDLQLPDGDGVALVPRLRATVPGLRCVILTAFNDDAAMSRALEAGVAAFVLKSMPGRDVVATVLAVAAGKVLLSAASLKALASNRDDPLHRLTPTERRVLDLVADGLTNRQIGDRLGLAEKTVKNHVTGLLGKLELQRRTQAAAWVMARRTGQWTSNQTTGRRSGSGIRTFTRVPGRP